MNQTISNSQIYKLFIIIATATKFLTLPSFYMRFAGRDAWFSIILNVLVDFVLLLCVLLIFKAHDNFTFSDVLEKYFGKVIAKILLVLISGYLIFRSIPFISENYDILAAVLYEVPNWYALVFPMYIVAVYLAFKGPRTMGRVAEIMFFFFIPAMIVFLILAVSEVNFIEILPAFEYGLKPPLSAAVKGATAFGDYGLMLMFMGRTEGLTSGKQMKGYAIASGIIILFNFLFVLIFGVIGVYQPDAIIRITQYNTSLTNYGRIDWLIALIWQVSQILYLSVLIFGASEFIKSAFNIKGRLPVMIGIMLIVEILIKTVFFSADRINDTFGSTMSYYFFALQYFLPLILAIISMVKLLKKRRRKQCRLKMYGAK